MRDAFDADATLHAVAENALDVPHTACLHRGLFRNDGDRRTLEVAIRRWAHKVEAQYIGEQRALGLVTDDKPMWVTVPEGAFQMGSPEYGDEQPVHRVSVSTFQVMQFPVIGGLWRVFDPASLALGDGCLDWMPKLAAWWAADPQARREAQRPVVGVNWFEVHAFACWLDPLARLPSEAEWEYAARGGPQGKTTYYWSGDDEADLKAVGWYKANASEDGCPTQYTLMPVGRPPTRKGHEHPLGLWDVHGNVLEWTACEYTPQGYPGVERADPRALREGAATRVRRGGGFLDEAISSGSALRLGSAPGFRDPLLECRPVRPV